ncbi:Xylose isomerase [Neomoorella glycerini]|uniref:Xylose isomerase n=1 Tax=Neomoorella glycerini TaxID=55779 RepID=A0A6I5ZPS0_9FIRM|nr:L-rhamnose isomerase [Moorella glycerini]QGP91607.1 Xylose isomerase [Moorella glycerini]
MLWEKQYQLLAQVLADKGIDIERVKDKLKKQVIELPSWAVGNSGTRYGTFREEGAAITVWDRIDDCAEIQRVVGICPVMATHVLWDVTEDGKYEPVREYAAEKGLRIGTVHPNTFMGQQFKFGSICNPFADVRRSTIEHFKDCVRIARELGSKTLGVWLADGTNYPGQDKLRERKHRLFAGLKELYDAMDADMTLLLEYKPFEPAFYTTDVMDWGMSYLMCTKMGDRAKVLVDLGHHLLGVNVEQIIAVLLDEGKMGGFHFNNHKYADDDLMVGSIDPYGLFLIFDQIIEAEEDNVDVDIVYMLDQSHNIEPSIEGIIQSVMNVQKAYARALLVDRRKLQEARQNGDVILANRTLMEAFEIDVNPLLNQVRVEMGIEPDPLLNYRRSGYAEKIARERKNKGANTLGG